MKTTASMYHWSGRNHNMELCGVGFTYPTRFIYMKKQRIEYIDIAKGIAIWLMIIGHQDICMSARVYIYSFHMPLFFILSGMFFKRELSLRSNIAISVRTLLIPYFVFSIINLSICWISPYLHPELYYNLQGIDVLVAAIKGIFIGTDIITKTSFMPLGALWFLIALFLIRVFCCFLARIIKNDILFIIVSVGMAILFFILMKSVYVFSLRCAMLALPFFVFGYGVKKIDVRLWSNKPIILIACVLYFILIIPLNGNCTIAECKYGNNLGLFYLNGIIGTIMVVMAASLVRSCLLAEKIGRHTLMILGLHPFFSIPIKVICVWIFGNAILSRSIYIILMSILVTLGAAVFGMTAKRKLTVIMQNNSIRHYCCFRTWRYKMRKTSKINELATFL